MPRSRFSGWLFLGTLLLALACCCQEPARAQGGKGQAQLQNPVALFNSIAWQHGPCLAKLRDIGQVQVLPGYKFTDAGGCRMLMELTQNLPNPNDMGLLCPSTFDPTDFNNRDWFMVFVWEDIGFVKDDEKGKLDADAILTALRQGTEQANPERIRRGFPSLQVVGWEQPPFYDPETNHLTWATRTRSTINGMPGAESINYNSRLLGRGGVMSVELVIAPDRLAQELPKHRELLKGYSFQPGQRYAEWRAGDKVATYGLTALISGGVIAAAAKSGLLAKFGKFIVYIVIAVAAGIGGMFKKLFGRRTSSGV